jgi:ankyrin repeat protein
MTLIDAAREGYLKMTQEFIVAGEPVDAVNGEKQTALMLAARREHTGVVRLLLNAGASVKKSDHKGMTALYEACLAWNPEIVGLLLEHKANPNKKNKTYGNPLGAALKGIVETKTRDHLNQIVRLLLDAKCKVDAADGMGETPLHIAALSGHADAVKMLLEAGADPLARSREGRIPSDGAVFHGHLNVLKVLDDHGGLDDTNGALVNAASQGHIEAVKYLLEKGASADARRSFDKQTGLMLAAYIGSEELVDTLLKAGANADLTDKKGRRAMDIARERGHQEVAALIGSATGPS